MWRKSLLTAVLMLCSAVLCMGQGTLDFVRADADGTITVRVSGLGKNKATAKEQAQKNAVRAAIFQGIKVPGKASLSRPLIYEVNAEEKYEDFFYAFFQDGGKYADFVSYEDRKAYSDKKEKKGSLVEVRTTLTILRPALKQYLIEQHIIETEKR